MMNTMQANRSIQWLRTQKDAQPVAPEPSPAAESVCICADSEEKDLQEAIGDPQPEAVQAWEDTLMQLDKELPRNTFDTWLKDTKGVVFKEMTLWVLVDSVFSAHWLEQRMYQTILRVLRQSSGESWDVMFCSPASDRICPVHPPE